MTNSRNNNQNQKEQSITQPGSGTKYHEEHAGNVTGYGEMDPNAEKLSNKTEE